MTPQKGNHGYMCIQIKSNKESQSFKVHRLVALTFLPNPNKLAQVDHIDSNPINNYVSNLQWISGADNTRKAHATSLLQYDKNGKLIKRWESIKEAADILNVDRSDFAKAKPKSKIFEVYTYVGRKKVQTYYFSYE